MDPDVGTLWRVVADVAATTSGRAFLQAVPVVLAETLHAEVRLCPAGESGAPHVLSVTPTTELGVWGELADGDAALLARLRPRFAAEVRATEAQDNRAQRVEAALKRSRAREKAILEALPDLLLRVRADGTVLWFKASDGEAYLPATQFFGRRVGEVVDGASSVLEDVLATGSVRTLDFSLGLHGDTRLYEARFSRIDMGEALVVVRDVTAARQAEERLRRSERFLARAQQAASVGYWARDVATGMSYWSDEVYRILGHVPGAVAATTSKFLDHVHPDDLAAVSATLDQIIAGEVAAPCTMEYRVRRPDGEGRDVVVIVEADTGAEGATAHLFGTIQDVTERNRATAEIARLAEENLQQRLLAQRAESQRLEGLGRLAGGIAHDFNNVLGVIMNYAAYLSASLEDEALRADAEQIHRSAERAASLTRQLLMFARRDRGQPRPIDLGQLLADLEHLLARTIGEDIELTLQCGQLPAVRADPAQVEHVLLNLALNARDAMPAGGSLTIRAARAANASSADVELPPGSEWACVEVVDTGHGMCPETLAHAFDPFFTTKPVGAGTGLGLAMVHGIVTQLGGHVTIASAPDEGTTVRILLPVIQGPVPVAAPSPPPDADAGGRGERVMVVEDEANLRAVVCRILGDASYEVVGMGNAAEALAAAGADDFVLHALVTDVVMPGLSGIQLAEALGDEFPGLAVVYMTGYSETPVHDGAADGTGCLLLEKPFSPKALLRAVRAVLDARPGRVRATSPAGGEW